MWDPSHAFRLTGNYAYQRGVDQSTNEDAGYGPQNHMYLRGDWRFASGWQGSLQGNRVTNRLRAAGDTRSPVPDYNSVDATLRTNLGKNWELAGSVRNLFDATIIEPTLPGTVPTDLPQAGRSWYLQALYKL